MRSARVPFLELLMRMFLVGLPYGLCEAGAWSNLCGRCSVFQRFAGMHGCTRWPVRVNHSKRDIGPLG